jgi:5-methylthioadenosine/S-adenosylhomocysteine deaminase
METLSVFTADWVIPVSSAPFSDGAVAALGERIVFVGPKSEAERMPGFDRAQKTDLGNAALMPGFVNTHAHLELTVMRGYLENLPFPEWIARLVRTKYRLSDEDLEASALLGAIEAVRSGITTIADTADSSAAFDAMIRTGLRGIAYREVFGPDPAGARASLAALREKVESMRARESHLVRIGVSPHAPYTVSAELFRLVAEFAAARSLDICIHAAESEAESELMLSGSGPFADNLRARGIEWNPPGASTIEYFESLGLLQRSPLLVHCVNVDAGDISLLARTRTRVAHCPKSNAKLGHGRAPLPQLLAANVICGLGTDSVASNNRCDLLDEARHCLLLHRSATRNFDVLTARQAIRLMTLGGAEALGLAAETGSLEVGKKADLAAVSLGSASMAPVNDIEAAVVFSAASSDLLLTAVSGRILFDGIEVKSVDERAVRGAVQRAAARLS